LAACDPAFLATAAAAAVITLPCCQAMYYDRKKQLIEQGKWFDDPDN
jgi:hypothetical protein